MASFENGVSGYVEGIALITVRFPIDLKGNRDVSCEQCQYFRRTYRTCGLNNAVCHYPKYIGAECPLTFKEDLE